MASEPYVPDELPEDMKLPPTAPAGLTVGQLFWALPEDQILASFEDIWPKAAERLENYRNALLEFRLMAAERTNLSCLAEMRLPFGDPEDHDEHHSVPLPHIFVVQPDPKGRPVRAPMLNMQLDWNKWSALDLLLGPGTERVPRSVLAAHIFWEMTWAGLQVENRDDRSADIAQRARKQDAAAREGKTSTIFFRRWDG